MESDVNAEHPLATLVKEGRWFYRVSELSEATGHSKHLIRTWIKRRELDARTRGRDWLVPRNEVIRFFGLGKREIGEPYNEFAVGRPPESTDG